MPIKMNDLIAATNPNPSDSVEKSSVFIWIDLLGFSALVENPNAHEKLIGHLRSFRDIFWNDSDYDSKILSDAILLQIKEYHHRNSHSRFIEILKDIGKRQFRFMLDNQVAMRGGIAVGQQLKFDRGEHGYISTGLARSYHVESGDIDWPVIATNTQYLKEIRKIFNKPDESEQFGLTHAFNKGGDDIYFIDFVQLADTAQEIESYERFVKIMLEQYDGKPQVRNKYIWLLKHLAKVKDSSIPEKWLKSIL